MVRTIRRVTVLENEANVGDDLICTVIARILVGIRLGEVNLHSMVEKSIVFL